MAVSTIDKVLLASKFRGCLVGALLGDCLGAPYEGEDEVRKTELQKYFDKLCGPYFKIPYKPYTDDTAMTKCVAESLLEHNGFDALDMAKKFVKEFFLQPRRGYGANVTTVFKKLKGSNYEDPFGPAREQFDGLGSYGNGAAMRTSPVALFTFTNKQKLLDIVRKSSAITHSNKLAVNGALLQSFAVKKCLNMHPSEEFNVQTFVTDLQDEIKIIEDEDSDETDRVHYYKQMEFVKKLLSRENPSDELVVNTLGHSVSAIYSVPTAVYSFLRAQNTIPGIETDNPFRRTIQYAISLGGDTDTIASMAGAIAGAYYGYDIINPSLQQHCEDTQYTIILADRLFEITCI